MAKSDFCFTYYDGDASRDMAHMTRLERGGYTDIIISQRKFGGSVTEVIITIACVLIVIKLIGAKL